MGELSHQVDEFLASLAVERGFSPATIEAYRRDLGQYRSHLSGRDPSMALIDEFVASLSELAPASVARKVAAVRGLHRFLVAEGLRDDDPSGQVDAPRLPDAIPKALEVDVCIRLMEAPDAATPAGIRDRAILELLYGTGARVSEAVVLDLGSLDLDDATVVLTGKGDKQRMVPLGREAVAALRAWLPVRLDLGPSSDAVFLNLRGGRLTRQGIFDVVRKAATSAGIEPSEVSPHVLRHSAATHMIEAGADIRSVQEMLGHANVSTTQVYTRVTPRHLREIYLESHPRSQ
ncbi:MAG TPA: site-specific tyrosine recombinase XerD [Acidimicrobiia bacterium]|nr:site-specific tyrosine recombinase XerD [Acidimicrobiia bacterium]